MEAVTFTHHIDSEHTKEKLLVQVEAFVLIEHDLGEAMPKTFIEELKIMSINTSSTDITSLVKFFAPTEVSIMKDVAAELAIDKRNERAQGAA